MAFHKWHRKESVNHAVVRVFRPCTLRVGVALAGTQHRIVESMNDIWLACGDVNTVLDQIRSRVCAARGMRSC